MQATRTHESATAREPRRYEGLTQPERSRTVARGCRRHPTTDRVRTRSAMRPPLTRSPRRCAGGHRRYRHRDDAPRLARERRQVPRDAGSARSRDDDPDGRRRARRADQLVARRDHEYAVTPAVGAIGCRPAVRRETPSGIISPSTISDGPGRLRSPPTMSTRFWSVTGTDGTISGPDVEPTPALACLSFVCWL